MNILHLIPGLANASGPTHVASRYADCFTRRGHEVSVFHVSGRGKDAVALPAGVENRSFHASRAKSWAFSPALAQALHAELSNFDIVHVHSLWCYPNLLLRRLTKRIPVPYVVRPAGSLEPWSMGVSALRKNIYFQAFEKSNLNCAAALHAMSSREAEHLSAYGLRPPVWTIPNGVDEVAPAADETLQAVRTKWRVPTDAALLLFLGRLHPVKNLPFLLQVFQALQKKHSAVYLLIAGPDHGEYAKSLKQRVAEQALQDRVIFCGEVRGGEKVDLLQAADLLCLPSLSENFGNVVLEALASGTAVFASNTSPWPELDEWGCGRSLPLEVEAWVSAMEEAFNPGVLMDWGAQARCVAQDVFSWEVISDRLEAAYHTVLGR